jgi:hypothetical protein
MKMSPLQCIVAVVENRDAIEGIVEVRRTLPVQFVAHERSLDSLKAEWT